MSELAPYQQSAPAIPITGGTPVPLAPLPPANDVDGWIQVVAQVAMLAERIADTDFVPDALRRKPAAVTAAILAGREMGVAPMTALQHINVIRGKPGQDAMLMRALVLAKGHQLEYGDCNDSRALVRGKRRGEETWTEVVFTADQARKARIDLGGYPEDKLIARATSRLCRRKFADVISGLSYTLEELQDGDTEFVVGDEPAALPAAEDKPAPARTAQRKPRTSTPKTAPAAPRAAGARPAGTATPAGQPAAATPTPSPQGPPLPGEDGYDEPPAEEEAPPDPATTKATTAQSRMMHALFREGEVDGRDDRLELTGLILDRELTSSAELTVADAKVVIDALSQLKASQDFPAAITAYLNAHEQLRMEAELAEQDATADDAQAES